MRTRRLLACAAVAALVAYAAASSNADEQSGTLPGIKPPPTIVKPEGEPPQVEVPDEDGFVRMGDWDVRISGTATVDLGAGSLPLPRR
jgi:hypothetical protein